MRESTHNTILQGKILQYFKLISRSNTIYSKRRPT